MSITSSNLFGTVLSGKVLFPNKTVPKVEEEFTIVGNSLFPPVVPSPICP
jgi:hypothetical protein